MSERIGYLEVDEDDKLEGVGLVAKTESGEKLHGPSGIGAGRYVLVREDTESHE